MAELAAPRPRRARECDAAGPPGRSASLAVTAAGPPVRGKRALDIVASSLLLLLCAPVLALVALCVVVGSGRPVLYLQDRVGERGRVFRMVKFRTMRRDAEAGSGPVWARPGDPRRTRVGVWLRRSSLDELPQLWNVLRGDMSLTGPRPERPVFSERFSRSIPGYEGRQRVRAGISGWAQVNGWRGATSLRERLEHDLYYIENWSVGLEIRIMLLTLWRGVFPRNAE